MLFNSLEFILAFLPITLVLFFALGKYVNSQVATFSLVAMSFVFYAAWSVPYLALLGGSIIFNYVIGKHVQPDSLVHHKKRLLGFGIFVNLGLLVYYKYTNFFIDNLETLLNTEFQVGRILLPLAISFFTFQQISYLVDSYRNKTVKHSFLYYSLFVVFFPQLIAGPIVQQKWVLSQYLNDKFGSFDLELFTKGLALFVLGLSKKVLIADNFAVYSSALFNSVEVGNEVFFFEAWFGALSYTFQLYFDFSGYSEMALGLGLMFGVHFPVNFNSPYRATSIIEFWKRWHMTLSNFLKNYLYIPLGGNKGGEFFRLRNIAIVMFLGGIWHGAGWTFVIWGGLHAFYITCNHIFRIWCQAKGLCLSGSLLFRTASYVVTFTCVVIAWVFFRADSVESALKILSAMSGLQGIVLSPRLSGLVPEQLQGLFTFAAEGTSWLGFITLEIVPMIVAAFLACLCLPSSVQMFGFVESKKVSFKFNMIVGCLTGILFILCLLIISARSTSEFLYFQF